MDALECIVLNFPDLDAATVEAWHGLIRRELEDAVDLVEVAAEADEVSLDQGCALAVEIVPPDLSVFSPLQSPELE